MHLIFKFYDLRFDRLGR